MRDKRVITGETFNYLVEVYLSEKEKKLIERLREIKYGRVTIFIQDSQILRFEKEVESEKV